MKIDIVNPIPPKIPAAKSCIKEISLEIDAKFNLFAIQQKQKIPSGLPINSPINMPSGSGWKSSVITCASIEIAVFAIAKRGNTKYETGI